VAANPSTKPDIKKLLKEARKQASPSSGVKIVAAALAASTRLDAKAAEKLMDVPFSSSEIGLKDKSAFRAFKKSLTFLVPGASDAIAKIPDEPGLSPADIARYIGGIARKTAAVAEPLRAAPAVIVKTASAEARKKMFGPLREGFCGESFGSPDSGARHPHVRRDARDGRSVRPVHGAGDGFTGRAAFPGSRRDHHGLRIPKPACRRTPGIVLCRDLLIRADLEKKLAKPVTLMRESAQDLGSATDVCWLNGTMRTLAPPKTIADIAGDPKVTRIGIPRALAREINITGATIGAIRFRSTNGFMVKIFL